MEKHEVGTGVEAGGVEDFGPKGVLIVAKSWRANINNVVVNCGLDWSQEQENDANPHSPKA